MNKLLGYTCAELNCYLDDLKGSKRSDISRKRKIATLVLMLSGMEWNEIATLLNKDRSTLQEAEKKADFHDKALAEAIYLNFWNWVNMKARKL